MTDEEKLPNDENSRPSVRDLDTESTVVEKTDSLIKTAEEKLQDVSGNLLRSPDIDPSIYQADIVGTTPAPLENTTETTSMAPETASEPTEMQESQTPETEKPLEEPEEVKSEETPSDVKTEEEKKPVEEPTEMVTGEPEVEGDIGMKTADDKIQEIDQSTTASPSTDPYKIDIQLEKKINKRTQRKLWEEIEKRKPLIPKYVEQHIKKYAKPPFELWGCKSRGKGSCYGCGS